MTEVNGGRRTADGENRKGSPWSYFFFPLVERSQRVLFNVAGVSDIQQLSPALFFHRPLSPIRRSQAPAR